MNIAFGTDHGGFSLKKPIIEKLNQLNMNILDMGSYTIDNQDDYPDIVEPVAKAVSSGKADRGILLCGSGIGASITANKFTGVRASVCHDFYSAQQGVEHDDMNIICIGARVINEETAIKIIELFLSSKFNIKEKKYKRRLDKLINIEKKYK
tara:strand:+ start:135 stop:590 length:456 start_codon:yes stop_codon:yes gene_type:complete